MPNNRLHCTALVPPQTSYHRGVQCFDVVLYEEPCVCTGNCIGHWALLQYVYCSVACSSIGRRQEREIRQGSGVKKLIKIYLP